MHNCKIFLLLIRFINGLLQMKELHNVVLILVFKDKTEFLTALNTDNDVDN